MGRRRWRAWMARWTRALADGLKPMLPPGMRKPLVERKMFYSCCGSVKRSGSTIESAPS